MISTFKRLIASLLALMLFVGAAPLARAASPAVPAPPAPPTAASSGSHSTARTSFIN